MNKRGRKARIMTTVGVQEVMVDTSNAILNNDVEIVETTKAEDNGSIITQIVVNQCKCINYNGEVFGCSMHPFTVKCPKCNTIKTELVISRLAPTVDYRCQLCGVFYQLNEANGLYNYK